MGLLKGQSLFPKYYNIIIRTVYLFVCLDDIKRGSLFDMSQSIFHKALKDCNIAIHLVFSFFLNRANLSFIMLKGKQYLTR